MKLLCKFCKTPIYLDFSNDKVAKAELAMYQDLQCDKNPDSNPDNKKHVFSVIQ